MTIPIQSLAIPETKELSEACRLLHPSPTFITEWGAVSSRSTPVSDHLIRKKVMDNFILNWKIETELSYPFEGTNLGWYQLTPSKH